MNSYYYAGQDGQPYGPVDPGLLKNYGVTRETLVWCEGMADWAKAGDVPELASLFAVMPPPMPQAANAAAPQSSVIYVNQPAQQQEEKSNACGVAGLVFSIIALFTSFVPGLSWLIWFLGFLLSLIGVFKEPRGTAIAGLVISLLGGFFVQAIFGSLFGSFGAFEALEFASEFM